MWVRICMVVAVSIIPSIPATTLCARDIYVNNVMGDDRFDGSSAVPSGDRIGPYRTLTRALARDSQRGSRDCREHCGALSRVHHAAGSPSERLSGRAV